MAAPMRMVRCSLAVVRMRVFLLAEGRVRAMDGGGACGRSPQRFPDTRGLVRSGRLPGMTRRRPEAQATLRHPSSLASSCPGPARHGGRTAHHPLVPDIISLPGCGSRTRVWPFQSSAVGPMARAIRAAAGFKRAVMRTTTTHRRMPGPAPGIVHPRDTREERTQSVSTGSR
jgi:hypothetical protein